MFLRPVYLIKTKNYLIRIDELHNENYRYASWKIGSDQNERPDLILQNGIIEMSGSGGNHTITFKNKNFTYTIYRNNIGTSESTPFSVIIERDGKTILNENGFFY